MYIYGLCGDFYVQRLFNILERKKKTQIKTIMYSFSENRISAK